MPMVMTRLNRLIFQWVQVSDLLNFNEEQAMKRLFISLVAMITMMFLFMNVFAADMKMGTVDMQKVVQSTPQFGQIMTDLKKQFGDREKKLVDSQNALKKANEDFTRNSSVMTANDRKVNEEKLTN